MINKAILLGNMTSDPETRMTATAKEVCRFTIALNGRNSNGDKTVDFIDCRAWNDTGRSIAKYFRKGDSICVVGSLKSSKYKTAHGDNAVSWYVNVTEWSFGGSSSCAEKMKAVEAASADDGYEVGLPDNEDTLPF